MLVIYNERFLDDVIIDYDHDKVMLKEGLDLNHFYFAIEIKVILSLLAASSLIILWQVYNFIRT